MKRSIFINYALHACQSEEVTNRAKIGSETSRQIESMKMLKFNLIEYIKEIDDYLSNPDDYSSCDCKVENIAYWCKLSTWTSDEAGALAVGCDPYSVHLLAAIDPSTFSDFLAFRRAAERFSDAKGARSPREIYRHLKNFEARFPEETFSHLKKQKRFYERFERKYNRLRKYQIKKGYHADSVLKIILSYVIDGATDSNSKPETMASAVKAVVDDAGYKIDLKTARKILNAAVDRKKYFKIKKIT